MYTKMPDDYNFFYFVFLMIPNLRHGQYYFQNAAWGPISSRNARFRPMVK